jgi:hypothetical protein
VLILGLSGWTAFTIYERLTRSRDTVAATPEVDSRVEAFVTQGRQHLAKGELKAAEQAYTKASGVAEGDPRVLEGLAMVQLARAEQTWWALAFGKHDSERRVALLRELDTQIDKARETVASSRKRVSDPDLKARLDESELRLNAMLVVALALHGDEERARGALAARLAEHPQKQLLADFVAMVGQPRPETERPDAGGEADAGPGPLAQTRSPDPAPKGPQTDPHYEFEQEPKHGMPKTPGELEITVGKEKVETKVLNPDPAPAPVPAPAPDAP